MRRLVGVVEDDGIGRARAACPDDGTGPLRPCKGFRRRTRRDCGIRRSGAATRRITFASRPYHAHVPAPWHPGSRETPLWHAGVDEPPAGVDDPGPLPAEADVVIVGGGYCGIAAAAELGRARPERRGRSRPTPIGTGASTRNGGMVIPELKHGPRELARRVRRARPASSSTRVLDAFALVERLVDEGSIDCDYARCGGVCCSRTTSGMSPGCSEAADEWQELLGDDGRGSCPATSSRDEIGTTRTTAGCSSSGRRPATREVPRRHSCARALGRGRARCTTDTRATRIERRPDGRLPGQTTTRGAVDARRRARRHERVRRRARPASCGAASCRSAASSSPRRSLAGRPRTRRCIPRRRMVLRHQEPPLLLAAVTRRPDGVRRADELSRPTTPRRRATCCTPRWCASTRSSRACRVEHAWGGNVAITFDRLPHCGRIDGIAYATGCNGTGVALATWFGVRAAAWLTGEEEPPAFADLRFAPIPFRSLRRWWLPPAGRVLRCRRPPRSVSRSPGFWRGRPAISAGSTTPNGTVRR